MSIYLPYNAEKQYFDLYMKLRKSAKLTYREKLNSSSWSDILLSLNVLPYFKYHFSKRIQYSIKFVTYELQ